MCTAVAKYLLVPGAGIEPARLSAEDFLPTSTFAAATPRVGVRGLEHAFTLAFALGARRLLSTPSVALERYSLDRH
ncbi:hypothetical protein GKR41_00243 [Candidatus Vallotia lariciata]|nr:hypothetical protein GKR41_00243 [Candidatus Vallotia lariciata]